MRFHILSVILVSVIVMTQPPPTRALAFAAQTNNGFTGSTSSDMTIQFNQVNVNIGNAYNSGTSHFTAPVAGLYSFSYAFFPHYEVSNLLSAHLVVNGADVGGATCKFPNSVSKPLVLHLSASDEVWVELKASVDPRLSVDDIYNTFSGYNVDITSESQRTTVEPFTSVPEETTPSDTTSTEKSQRTTVEPFTTVLEETTPSDTTSPEKSQRTTVEYSTFVPTKTTTISTEFIRTTTAGMPTTTAGMTTTTAGMTPPPQTSKPPSTRVFIAFAAQTNNGFTGSTSSDTTIHFNHATVNIGNAYNSGTSHFTAPVSGLYSLSYAFFSHIEVSNLLSAHLVVNGADVGGATCKFPKSVSKSLVLHLSASDEVWVELKASVDPRLSVDDIYNTFSGYNVFEDV